MKNLLTQWWETEKENWTKESIDEKLPNQWKGQGGKPKDHKV